MNQVEMNEVASQLEEAFAQDYIEARLNKEYLPQYTKAIVRAVCIHLRAGNIEKVSAEIRGVSTFLYPQTNKVLMKLLVGEDQ
jgi:hypothetical protein